MFESPVEEVEEEVMAAENRPTLKTPLRKELLEVTGRRGASEVVSRKGMATPLRKGIQEAVSKRTQITAPKALKTPLRQGIVTAASQRDASRPPALRKSMKTPLKLSIVQAASERSSGRQTAPVTMKTPLKRGIMEAVAMRQEVRIAVPRTLKTPLRKDIVRIASQKGERKPLQGMKTPLKRGISEAAQAKRGVYDVRVMDGQVQKELVRKVAGREPRPVLKTVQTPLRRDIVRKAKGLVTEDGRTLRRIAPRELVRSIQSVAPRSERPLQRLPTPVKKELVQQRQALKPRYVVHKAPTPLREQIQSGALTLRPIILKPLTTPLKRDLEDGTRMKSLNHVTIAAPEDEDGVVPVEGCDFIEGDLTLDGDMDVEEEEEPKKKGGRKRKAPATEPSPTPRKRGRPKKVLSEDPVPASAKKGRKVASKAAPNTETPKKRGRRPSMASTAKKPRRASHAPEPLPEDRVEPEGEIEVQVTSSSFPVPTSDNMEGDLHPMEDGMGEEQAREDSLPKTLEGLMEMKVLELRSALKERNLTTTGVKATLAQRLLDYLTSQ